MRNLLYVAVIKMLNMFVKLLFFMISCKTGAVISFRIAKINVTVY